MPRYLWLRIGVVVAVIVGSLLLVAPRDWRGQPRQPINLGLDLQGGIHLVLGVDLEKGIENVLDRMAGDLRAALQKKGIGAQVTRQGRTGLVVQLSLSPGVPQAQQAWPASSSSTRGRRTRRRAGSSSRSRRRWSPSAATRSWIRD